MTTDPGFLYANLDNAWAGLTGSGVVVRRDGALALAPLPLSIGAIGAPLSGVAWTGPAGIGVDGAGNLYVADPRADRILRVDACDGSVVALDVPAGTGAGRTQLSGPRGVAVGPGHVLYVVDSGNHRVYVIDLATLAVRGIWGQPDANAAPAASADPGRFRDPGDIAVDASGAVYVVDHGNARIQKFTPSGDVVVSFWSAMSADPPGEPAWIAIMAVEGTDRVAVLDVDLARLSIHHLDGARDATLSSRWQTLGFGEPGGLAIAADAVYVGDAVKRRVAVFGLDGGFVGFARGYEGAIAGLAVDRAGRLLVHPGAGAAIAGFARAAGCVTRGTMRIGPFSVADRPARWDRVALTAEPLGPQTHVRLFACVTPDAAPAPAFPPPAPADSGADPTPLGVWRAMPTDAVDALLLYARGRYLWIGAQLDADGTTSPVIHQARLEYERETWLRHLPSVYSRDDATRVFLERALTAFETSLGDSERRIDDLARLFDPLAAPDGDAGRGWLDWLAGWVALELGEARPEAERRRAVAGAFDAYAWRGTAEGIRRLVRMLTGADAWIDDASTTGALWSLGESSVLGFSTGLAAGHPQGAVLGTTATLDHAHLVEAHEAGAPLFDAIAHRVCVQVRRADVRDACALDTVRRVVDDEVPAHVAAHVCVLEPALRVGFQARLGIDAIVGGPPSLVLNDPRRLGIDAVLGPAAPARPGGAPADAAWLTCATNGGQTHA